MGGAQNAPRLWHHTCVTPSSYRIRCCCSESGKGWLVEGREKRKRLFMTHFLHSKSWPGRASSPKKWLGEVSLFLSKQVVRSVPAQTIAEWVRLMRGEGEGGEDSRQRKSLKIPAPQVTKEMSLTKQVTVGQALCLRLTYAWLYFTLFSQKSCKVYLVIITITIIPISPFYR